MCVMRKITKQVLAAVCALVLVLGSGLSMSSWAFDTDATAEKREWILYSGSKEFEIRDNGDLVVEVSNGNVTIPDNVKMSELSLSITMSIPNEDVLVSLKDGVIELAQDTCDVAEISWNFAGQSLKVGENVIEFELTEAIDTGGGVAFDIDKTINWFRIYSMTNSNGSTATLKEVKLVDGRVPGFLFGEKKTYDTYLQLTDSIDSTPQSIEASVKMQGGSTAANGWLLSAGNSIKITSGQVLTTGTTVENDAPGAGMTYSVFDATSGAQTYWADNSKLDIDASNYELSDLAVEFWVYSNETGIMSASGDNQMRISSSTEGLGAKFLYYSMQSIHVQQGWNHISLPLDTWSKVDDTFTTSDIQRIGFTPYMLSEGSCRYIGDIKLVVMTQDEEGSGEPEDEGIKWTLREGSSTKTSSGHTLTTGVTTDADAPGAGMKYTILDASNNEVSGFGTLDNKFGINAGEYAMSELAVAFWVWSNEAGTLGTGDQFRIGSGEYLGSNALIYYYKDIPVEAGWNYIQLPLSDWGTDIKGSFSVSNINCFGFTAYKLAKGQVRYFGDFELVVIPPQTEWTLRPGTDTTIWSIGSGHTLTTGKTTEGAAPGADVNYMILDASSKAVSGFATRNTGLGINVSDYELNKLAVAFWAYADKAGTLGTGDQFRIGSADYLGSDALIYYFNQIPIEAGWNYIELPLDEWETDIKQNFTLSNIKTFGFTGYNLEQGNVRYFTDFKLIVKKVEPITSQVLREGSDITNTTGHTLTTGTTVAGDKPGAGKTYSIFDASSNAISGFHAQKSGLGIDASATELSDLAVAFWIYSNKAGTLGTGDQFRIGSTDYVSKDALIYYFNHIEVKAGWNYIKLPLDTWQTDIKGNFTTSNINCFGFTNYNLAEGEIRYFTDIKLINMNLVEDEMPAVQVTMTENVTTLGGNYMVFSNTNAEDENTYALFITAAGYPSLLYGTTQFTLTQDVRTGEWVDIAAVRDDDGYISFYINGEIAARSDVAVAEIGTPTTAHCIGADGIGGQIMDGRIADVRLWNDVRTADEIKNNLIEKEAGVVGNGLNENTEGLLGNWFLIGNIQDVLETVPDASANANNAVYRGSRADDWIDYEIPEEIGEDYWSIIFIPDIQNLIRTHEYNKTWLAIGQWIADNANAENIQHVIGAGDSSWNATEDEFNRAMAGFSKFDDLVPTNVIIGNHDYQWGTTERVTTMYQKYFGEDAIKSSAASTTYVGYFDDPAGKSTTENSYYRFSVNGTKWMILQLEYHPRVSVMKWAQEILEKHADDNVIVTTHAYLDGWGEYASNTYMEYTQNDANDGGSIGETGEAIWHTYLKDYTNVKMILCGHRHNGTGSVVERIETNVAGEEVPALMINAQDVDAGDGSTNIKEQAYYDDKPIGMLGILRFSADGTNVALQYYAPTSEKSFSPEDPFGNEDSNNLAYELSVEVCSHTNTIEKVNVDAATGSTNGYTGDEYCTDCETMVSMGTILPATGEKQETQPEAEQGTEQGGTQNDNTNKDESPKTGDSSNMMIWFAIFTGSVVTAYCVQNKCRKEEE